MGGGGLLHSFVLSVQRVVLKCISVEAAYECCRFQDCLSTNYIGDGRTITNSADVSFD